VVLAGAAFALGCSKRPTGARVFAMGEHAEVGSLIYTVLETEWHDRLGAGPAARPPRNRFLAVRVSVTNSGAALAAIPPMSVLDASGAAYPEEDSGQGLEDWLGMLRTVAPAQTEQGRVLFDVPRGDYQLRVTDDTFEPEDQHVALIEVPLRFESGPPGLPR
jgi:hypothetical protein